MTGEPSFGRLVGRGKTRFSQEMTLGPYMCTLAKTAGAQRVLVRAGRAPSKLGSDAEAKADGMSLQREGDGRGGVQEDEVSLGVLRVCAEFGCWLWNTDDPQGFVVFHLDASRHHAEWEGKANGLPPSEMLHNYRKARELQALGMPVEAVLPLVPQTTGKRVLAETMAGLCQRPADAQTSPRSQ